MIKDVDKYRDIFLSEAKDHVEDMNKTLLKLERDPAELELIDDIFRHAHSLKSMAATMEYHKTAQLCHALEDVLDAVRGKRVGLINSIDILFESFDSLEAMLKGIKEDKDELDTTTLMQSLQALITSGEVQRTGEEATFVQPTKESRGPSPVVDKITSIEVNVERLDLLMNLAEELLINKMRLDKIKEDLEDPELTAVSDTLARLISGNVLI